MRNADYHPGISMHKLPVGAGAAGFIFAVGMVLVFLLKLPALWGFLVPAVIVGALVALFLQGAHRSGARKRLTIIRLH